MEREYLQEIVDRLKENSLMELLGDRAQVNLIHYPNPVDVHEHIVLEVRVGDLRVHRKFTFDELQYTSGPTDLVAIEIATLLARAILVEGV